MQLQCEIMAAMGAGGFQLLPFCHWLTAGGVARAEQVTEGYVEGAGYLQQGVDGSRARAVNDVVDVLALFAQAAGKLYAIYATALHDGLDLQVKVFLIAGSEGLVHDGRKKEKG